MSVREMFHSRLYDLPPSDFQFHNNGGSDISLSLPVIHFFAGKCKHCTEFGTRHGFSTVALMYGMGTNGKLVSYDVEPQAFVEEFKSTCLREGYNWEFKQQNTGDENLVIEETDFLFVDTLHYYNHVIKELRHAHKVRHYIGFHDTTTCWDVDHSGSGGEGIGRAIESLLATNQWDIVYQTYTNNGLMILERNDRNHLETRPIYLWRNNRFEQVGTMRNDLGDEKIDKVKSALSAS